MSKKVWVEDLAEGQGVDDLFQLEVCDLRQARNGSRYLHLILKDRTGSVNARRWDARREETEDLHPGDIVRIGGFVETFRGRPQVIVRRIEGASQGEGDPSDFFAAASRAPEIMLSELREILKKVENPHLQSLIEAFFADEEFVERFSSAPAATRIHHAYIGGLLEHTLSMARFAVGTASHYPILDRDVLLTGVFLHDLGKTEELSVTPMVDYTDRGKLLGHIEIGTRLLEGKAEGLDGFPRGLLDVLTHMILSHHGRLEYGSPKLPMTPEAVTLHLLDNLDAKLAAIEALKDGGDGGIWTEYVRGFERAFYVGGEEGLAGSGG
ncbi:MAG: 3'-5' exoribonuclease YhaM family protein [Planctomycetota bacterium]|jgi:3'-5' exoribonuclease